MERDLDTKLYNDFLDGQKEAFEFLYNKYKEKLQYFIYNIVKDYQKAEDLTQETFIYVMNNKIKENCSFKYYIYLVAKSKAFNYSNIEKRRNEIAETYLSNENEKDVLDIITKQETNKEVLESIELLDEKYRNAIYLTQIEGLSYEQTANILGQTLSNTKNLIHRGKKQLRIILLKKGFDKMNKVSKVVTILLCMVVMLSGITYAAKLWNVQFKKFEKTIESPNEAITQAKESGYIEEFDSDYDVKDGVGIKVDSFLKTDDCLNMTVNFKFAEDTEVNSDTFEFGYIIYDENKNVYQVAPRIYFDNQISEHDMIVSIFKEMEINFDEDNIFESVFSESSSIENMETEEDRTIVKEFTIRAKKSYPKSEKIYIKFFDLGYTMMDKANLVEQAELENIEIEEFDITNKEWTFEIDVLDEMSKAENKELKVKDEIPNIEIKSCTLTETGMVILLKTNDYIDYVCIGKEMKNTFPDKKFNIFNIMNSDGKFYDNIGNGPTDDGLYKIVVDVPKSDLEKGLFVDYESNGVEYKSELIEK